MMGKKKKGLIAGLVGLLIVLAIGVPVVSWISGRSVRKVNDLQAKLMNSEDLSKPEFNALKLQLMRTVDEMPRDKAGQLYGQLEQARQATLKEDAVAFQTKTDRFEKQAFLDQVLAKNAKYTDLRRAIRSDGARSRRERTKAERERDKAAGEVKKSLQAGEITQEQAEAKWKDLYAAARKAEPEPTEEEKTARKQEREQRDTFYAALEERAKATGVEASLRRYRRKK